MKKFLQEFKAFAMRGNVLDLAVGMIIGSAFNAIVNSLVKDIISPTIGLFFNTDFSALAIMVGDVAIGYGAFLTAVVNFLINALTLFIVIKAVNKAAEMRKKEEVPAAPAAPAEPTEKECPYCCSKISIKATRCPHCTSVLEN